MLFLVWLLKSFLALFIAQNDSPTSSKARMRQSHQPFFSNHIWLSLAKKRHSNAPIINATTNITCSFIYAGYFKLINKYFTLISSCISFSFFYCITSVLRMLCSERSQSNSKDRLGFLQAISRLSFRDGGRMTLRAFYHRRAPGSPRLRGKWRAPGLVAGGFWWRLVPQKDSGDMV